MSKSTLVRLVTPSTLVLIAISTFNAGLMSRRASAFNTLTVTNTEDSGMGSLRGTGVVKLVNGIRTLTDFRSNIRLSAGFNVGQRTGNATIALMVAQGVWETFRIFDNNPSAICTCQ